MKYIENSVNVTICKSVECLQGINKLKVETDLLLNVIFSMITGCINLDSVKRDW
jgi:hypothetical protein